MENKYFKFNEDDVMEILIEYLAKENGFGTFDSKAELILDNNNVTFVAVIGEQDNSDIHDYDMKKIYTEIDYNGTHDGRGNYSKEKWEEISDLINKRGSL